jgi:hypothetical protein
MMADTEIREETEEEEEEVTVEDRMEGEEGISQDTEDKTEEETTTNGKRNPTSLFMSEDFRVRVFRATLTTFSRTLRFEK